MLHDRLATLGAELILVTLADLPLPAEAQPEEGVTYAEKIIKSEARVNWDRPAVEVDRLIRGLSPFPGAWCEICGDRVKLLGSRLVGGAGDPAQVLTGLTVACGDGAVEITALQRAGKTRLSAEEYLRGAQTLRIS